MSRVICAVTAAMLALALSPVAAWASPHSADARQSVAMTALAAQPASIPDAPTLAPSPAAGSISDQPVVFAVTLQRGERLSMTLTGDAATDFDLYLLYPTAASPDESDIAAQADQHVSYPERMVFDAAWEGTYYVLVEPYAGSGSFTLSYSISHATASPTISRMAGLTRYETAVDASAKTFANMPSRDVVLASGQSFPDSLSAAGLAGVLGCPLILTRPEALPAAVLPELERLEAIEVHIVGGTGAVSTGVEQTLDSAGFTTYRYGGLDRYETSAIVARQVRELSPAGGPDIAFLARGDLFPDALVVSPIAYARRFPILLTRSAALPPSTAGALTDLDVSEVIVAGGVGAVSPGVLDQVAALPMSPVTTRVGGTDRYETASLMTSLAMSRYWASPSTVGVASGIDFPDALCGGAALGVKEGLLVLSRPDALASQSVMFIRENADIGLVDGIVLFGGTGALSAGVENEVGGLIQ